MAYYAALTSLSQILKQIPKPHVHQQIASLHDKVSRLLLMLGDLPSKSSLMIRDLEGKIRDASYEAENIIESNISGKSLISPLQNVTPGIHPRQRLVDTEFHGLEQIIDEFESILVDASDMIDDGRVEELQSANSPGARSSRFCILGVDRLVGFEEDLTLLKDKLCGGSSRRSIIPIVGMGGIGKTALARNLYEDSLIVHHFHIRVWVVVSQEYHVREMLMDLLISTGRFGGNLHQMSIEQLMEALYIHLKGWRYLIVMDDVWSTKVCDEIQRSFPHDDNGSRIILTTRMTDVALRFSGNCHPMSLLSREASWNLLHEKVFGKERCPPALEDIGKRIAENCKGLPLTIIAIGGLLSACRRTRDSWEYVAEDVYSVCAYDDEFRESLLLSYNSLPRHVKPCFLYMGVFPEDYEISVSQLIKLWIAEGFIEPQDGESLEEVALDYLNDLIYGNLIMVRKRKWNGEIKTCVLHDTFRELCIQKAQEEKFVQIMNWEVCGFPEGRNNNLRVFDALTITFYEFPIEILELIHLRYLAFLYRGNSFPASISELQNLQTIVALSVQPIYLPPTMWEMPQLRHLLIKESFLSLQIVRKNSVALELQTLSGVTNFQCTKEVVKLMPSLKKLGISYIHDTDTKWSYYGFNNFVYFYGLEKLRCLFIAERLEAERRLPINLAFPLSLKKLTLSGCRIPWEKMTVIGKLPNLEVLKLKDHAFGGPVWEPTKEEFLTLKFLLIDMSFLKKWRVDNTHFPRLQRLSLSFCPKLAKIPLEFGNIETLEMIELYECTSSAVASAMEIQKEQRFLGNDILRVRVNSYSGYRYSQQQKSLRKVHSAVSAW